MYEVCKLSVIHIGDISSCSHHMAAIISPKDNPNHFISFILREEMPEIDKKRSMSCNEIVCILKLLLIPIMGNHRWKWLILPRIIG